MASLIYDRGPGVIPSTFFFSIYSMTSFFFLNIVISTCISLVFAGRLLPGKVSGIAGAIKEVMAPILKAPSAAQKVGVSISVLKAVNSGKETEPLAVVPDIETENEPSPTLIWKQ